jgi:hypothetical protein
MAGNSFRAPAGLHLYKYRVSLATHYRNDRTLRNLLNVSDVQQSVNNGPPYHPAKGACVGDVAFWAARRDRRVHSRGRDGA